MKMCKKFWLILSFCFWEIGILLYSFISMWFIGAIIIAIGVALFFYWTSVQKFEDYLKSPFKNKESIFHKRDIRLKTLLFLILGSFSFIQFFVFSLSPYSNRSEIKSPIIGSLVIFTFATVAFRNAAIANDKKRWNFKNCN